MSKEREMKRSYMLTLFAMTASFGFLGCGSSSSSSGITNVPAANTVAADATTAAPDANVPTIAISGKAIDPELVGAAVCLDLNVNGQCDEGEPLVATGSNGEFALSLTEEQVAGGYPLIATGGIDRESGMAFLGTLMAWVDSNYPAYNITPLTTLLYQEMVLSASSSAAEAQDLMQKTQTILDLSVDEMLADIIALANTGNESAMKRALILEKSAEAIYPGSTLTFYQALAATIVSAADTDTLESLILQLAQPQMRDDLSTLIRTIGASVQTNSYALAAEARATAESLGIDQQSLLGEEPGAEPQAPDVPQAPDMPDTPEVPDTPDMPQTPSVPDMPGTPGM